MALECLIRWYFSIFTVFLCNKLSPNLWPKPTPLDHNLILKIYTTLECFLTGFNFSCRMIFIYIFLWTCKNSTPPNSWLSHHTCREHDLNKLKVTLPKDASTHKFHNIWPNGSWEEEIQTFQIVSTWKKVWPFILTHLNYVTKKMICAKFD